MSNVAIASVWMIGALASFSVMAICGRELADGLNTFQILFWRSMVSLVFIFSLLTYFGWSQVRTSALRIHTLRNLAHFGGQFGWFFAIAMIPLVEVFAMEFTIPIWTAVVASVFLGERLTFGRVMAIAFGFCGILIILRPGLSIISIGSIAALGAALGYATAHTATRFLAQRDTPLCILFFMALMQLPIAFFPSLYDWKWPIAEDWPWIVLVGLTAISAHYTLTRAFKLAEATVVVPMEFLRLPVIAAIGYAFYDESIEFWVGIGAVLICTGIIFNLRGAYRD